MSQANFRTEGRGARQVLVPAVLSNGRDLSTEAKKEILGLSGARPGRWLLELVVTWVVVFLAVGLALAADHWAATVIAVAVVATRQIVLGLLMHEQVHRLGLRGRWGDTLANMVAVYPLMATTVEDYAEVHLRHHRHFMTERDPDFTRKRGAEWTFPMSIGRLLRVLAGDLSGLNTVRMVRGKTAPPGQAQFKRPNPTPRWMRLLFFVVAAVVITLLDAWGVVLIFWVLPLLTVTQVLLRWIAVLEHEYNHADASVEEVTPLVRLTWWQRVVLPDLNFALHVYHHNHPGISFSQLPRVHEIYRREGKIREEAVFRGAGAYLRFLLGGRQGQLDAA